MSKVIAVTGKGGVGKTTIAGILISRLIAQGKRPVLAVDADPNACLDAALGVSVVKSVGRVREEAREEAGKGLSGGVAKQQFIEMKIEESLIETEFFDFISMGRPEGPGCYCYANNVLKSVISRLASQYPYVVLDNEAGLENLSRRIVQQVDELILVSDPSRRGIETLLRLHDLAHEMKIEYKQLTVMINRLRSEELPDSVSEIRKSIQPGKILGLVNDTEIARLSEAGDPVFELSEDNPVVRTIDRFVNEME